MTNLHWPSLIFLMTIIAGVPAPGMPAQVMTGRYGVGLGISTHENPIAHLIAFVRPGGPAEQAGLKKDDEIIAVDDNPVAKLTTTEVGGLLSATHESPVRVRIRRGSNEFDITVQRASMERIYNVPPRGKPAPSFTLQDMNGKTASLEGFKGRPVIVVFWATWCGPCVAESDKLNKLARKYERLVILGLDVDDKPDALEQFLQKRPLSYTVLKAGKIDGPVATSYGVTGPPLTVVIGANGLVDFVAGGGLTEDTLETHIRSVMTP